MKIKESIKGGKYEEKITINEIDRKHKGKG